ncbi:hypothetical protein bthur0010_24180 [Bacillus thuringiensis serovar pondicheriensis BGSC 4BA1]|nr:hypothetical protein bthur0010_24180 [Bacillus thuringiensis serovar pondicheriensis BGSC 4BA1]
MRILKIFILNTLLVITTDLGFVQKIDKNKEKDIIPVYV